MIHLRRDYDRIQDPDGKIDVAEPVFLLRGQDPWAARAVRSWATYEKPKGDNEHAVWIAVHRWADFMAEYARTHGRMRPTVDLTQLRVPLLDAMRETGQLHK